MKYHEQINPTRIAWANEGDVLRDKSINRGISALSPKRSKVLGSHTAEQISLTGTVVIIE